jgi:hypothetical protein
MNRVASILTGLSLAVLFFGASAHAQSEQRISGNIPLDFTGGTLSLLRKPVRLEGTLAARR